MYSEITYLFNNNLHFQYVPYVSVCDYCICVCVHVCVQLMAGGRLRIHYCRLIVATSAVWFIVDVILFVYFTDCLLPTERCLQQQQQVVTSSLSVSRQPHSFFGRLLPGGLCLSHVLLYFTDLTASIIITRLVVAAAAAMG